MFLSRQCHKDGVLRAFQGNIGRSKTPPNIWFVAKYLSQRPSASAKSLRSMDTLAAFFVFKWLDELFEKLMWIGIYVIKTEFDVAAITGNPSGTEQVVPNGQ